MGPAILKMERYVCKAKQKIFQSNSSKLESSAIILNCTVCKVTLNGKALQRAHDSQDILSPTSAGCSKTQNTNTNTNTKVSSYRSATYFAPHICMVIDKKTLNTNHSSQMLWEICVTKSYSYCGLENVLLL